MTSYVTEEMRRSMADKVLTVVAEYEGLIVYRLGPADGSWVESTQILVARAPLKEQIIITSDLLLRNNGVASQCPLGAEWFGAAQSEASVCAAFLQREFVPEQAQRDLVTLLRAIEKTADKSNTTSARLTRVKAALRRGIIASDDPRDPHSPTASSDAFYEFCYDAIGDEPVLRGLDYELVDAAWLCAIQQRFAECYAALQYTEPSLG